MKEELTEMKVEIEKKNYKVAPPYPQSHFLQFQSFVVN